MPGVTDEGFEIKTFDQIKTEYESDFRDIFGENINLSSTSLLGGLIGIMSNNDSQLWELGSSVYLSRWVNTATGRSLDNNVNFLGLTRKQDFRTSGEVFLFGDVGTSIPEGTILGSGGNLNFVTLSNVELISGLPPIMRISREAGLTTDTVMLIPSDDLFGIFQPPGTSPSFNFSELTDDIKTDLEGYFGENTIESVHRVTASEAMSDDTDRSVNDLIITFRTNMFLPGFTSDGVIITFEQIGRSNGIPVSVASQDSGPFDVAAGQVNRIITPIDGLSRVINFLDFIPGRYAETDEELRRRWINRVRSPINSTKDSIKNALESLDGVTDAYVFDVEDNDSIPPLSLDIVVNGGDEDDIAQVIYNTKPPGIRLSARVAEQSVTANATDNLGNIKPILFSRPDIIVAEARVTIQKLSTFPPNGDSEIRQAIFDFQTRLPIGSVVRPSPDMIWALEGIMGINSLSIEISVEGSPFSSDPYPLQTHETLSFSSVAIIEESTSS